MDLAGKSEYRVSVKRWRFSSDEEARSLIKNASVTRQPETKGTYELRGEFFSGRSFLDHGIKRPRGVGVEKEKGEKKLCSFGFEWLRCRERANENLWFDRN